MNENYNTEKFLKGLNQLHIHLSENQMNQFLLFYEMLLEKNKVMNLTSITEFDDVIEKHFLDSLCLNQIIDIGSADTILDLGTGAGFPGIPLKIVWADASYTLLDSLQKRINFLQDTIDRLGLTNIHAVHGRAEEIARDRSYRETYDICVSRAVANLAVLSEYCLPFVKRGGSFVAYKSSNAEHEIMKARKSVKILGGEIDEIKYFSLPGSNAGRCLVKIKKIKNTPSQYPRKAGTPSRKPLGAVE